MTRRPRRRELLREIEELLQEYLEAMAQCARQADEIKVLDAALEAERQWRLSGAVPTLLAAEERAHTWRSAALEAQATVAAAREEVERAIEVVNRADNLVNRERATIAQLRERLSEAGPGLGEQMAYIDSVQS